MLTHQTSTIYTDCANESCGKSIYPSQECYIVRSSDDYYCDYACYLANTSFKTNEQASNYWAHRDERQRGVR